MKIFADYHHSGLFFSLKLTLEDRLGHELYRPVGEEWFNEGFWDIAKPYQNSPDTVKQYLSLDSTYYPVDGSPPLNKLLEEKPGYYLVDELYHDYQQKAITLEQFKAMDIDVIIASIPDHYITYKKLRDKYKPNAKVICQTGNILWDDPIRSLISDGTIKNLMASVKKFDLPSSTNAVFYHQEQPLVGFQLPRPIISPFGKESIYPRAIKSFCHLLPKPDQYFKYKEQLPDFNWKAYGASCPDGALGQLNTIYDEIRGSTFVYHVKPGGDGYGWNWHSAYLLGRPVLTNLSDYIDKLGGELFVDGVNGLNLEAHTVSENCELIRYWAEPENHAQMCRAAYDSFTKIVNYEEEGKRITKFLENLVQ